MVYCGESPRRRPGSLLAPKIEPYAPDLLTVECANVIRKKVRRGEIASATPHLDGLARLSEVNQLGAAKLRDATETALRIGHRVYDGLLLCQELLEGEVREVTDGELDCPGCDRNKLVCQYHAGKNGGHMTCQECGRVSMSSPL